MSVFAPSNRQELTVPSLWLIILKRKYQARNKRRLSNKSDCVLTSPPAVCKRKPSVSVCVPSAQTPSPRKASGRYGTRSAQSSRIPRASSQTCRRTRARAQRSETYANDNTQLPTPLREKGSPHTRAHTAGLSNRPSSS